MSQSEHRRLQSHEYWLRKLKILSFYKVLQSIYTRIHACIQNDIIQIYTIFDVNSHFIFISFFLSTRVSSYVMRNKNKSHQHTRTHSHICRFLTFLLFLISVKIFEQTGKIDKKWDTKRLWTRTSRDFWFFSRNIFKSCHRRRCRCQCLTSFNLIFRRVSRKHLLRRNIFFLFSCTTHRWTG